MAILPQSRRTEPADIFDLRFRGLGLPVVKRPQGYLQTQFSRELLRSSIMTILSTRKGERVFLPEFGSNLFKLLFEQNDPVTRALIKNVVVEDVLRWEKRVKVRDVRVTSNENSIKVYVEYEIVNTSIVDATTLSFSSRTLAITPQR